MIFSVVRRFRRTSAALLLALFAATFMFAPVRKAEATPLVLLTPFLLPSFSNLTAALAAFTIVGSMYYLSERNQSAIPLTDTLGASPGGYSSPGAPNAGTLVLLENTNTRERTGVVLATQPKEEVMNPDLGDSKTPVAATGPWVFPAAAHIYMPADALTLSTTTLGASGSGPIPEPFRTQFVFYSASIVGKSGWLSSYQDFDANTLRVGYSCVTISGGVSGGFLTNNRLICMQARRKSDLGVQWVWTSLSNTTTAKTCSTDYEYDPVQNMCVFKPQAIDDGYCKVSPSKTSYKYEFNPADPDCIKAVALGGMNFTPGSPGGNGVPPTPPQVSMTDPSSGSVLIQSAPGVVDPSSSAQTVITQRVPDVKNNITKETITRLSPGTSTSTNPSAAPVPSQSTTNVYPGTNPGTSTTGSPMQQVAVSNWPSSITVNGTVACSNCTSAAPVVNVPDKMKIDGEVPGEFSSLPVAPTDLPAADTFIGKLKTRVAGFADFKLPAHASSCPAIDIHWNAWMVNIDASSNYMCSFLEQNRALFQGLMTFAFTVGAIIILLGA